MVHGVAHTTMMLQFGSSVGEGKIGVLGLDLCLYNFLRGA
jgi:hypothetical protein